MKKGFILFVIFFTFVSAHAWNGTGSESDPYQISSPSDLVALSNSTVSHAGEFFKMTSDIDMAEIVDFKPIGRVTTFKGTFNGSDFKIKNLQLKADGLYDEKIALFAQVENGVIENVHIAGASRFEGNKYIAAIVGYVGNSIIRNCSSSALINGANEYSKYIAGIIGYASGSLIVSCYNMGVVLAIGGNTESLGGVVAFAINGSCIQDCYNVGNILGNDWVGGVAGYVGDTDTIRRCYNNGNVSGGEYTGGVAGHVVAGLLTNGVMSSCYNTGKVSGNSIVGGVAGSTSSTSFSCNLGEVTGTGRAVGGIAGGGVVSRSYNKGDVDGNSLVGGIVGNVSKVTVCYNTGSISAEDTVGGLGGAVLGTTSCFINNSYNVGTVAINASSTIGGILGSMKTDGLVNSNEVKKSYWNKDVFVGKGVGNLTDTTANTTKFQYFYKNTAGMKASFHDTLGTGWSQDVENINNGYPVITDFTDSVIIHAKTTYTVTASAGINGSITPSGAIEISEGASVLYTIAPEEGYILDKVLIDGVEKEAIEIDSIYYYSLESISGNHTVSVTFKLPHSGISEINKENISCYMADNYLYISHAAGSQLNIYDINGKLLFQQMVKEDNEKIYADFLQRGIFLVRLQNKAETKAFKIVK